MFSSVSNNRLLFYFLGKEIEIDIEPTDKVERIKERVEEKEGIPPPQQRLIFSGRCNTIVPERECIGRNSQ